MNLLFDAAIYELHHKHGQLARRIAHIEREQVIEMSQVDELNEALGALKGDLATKFGEIQTEMNKLEQEKSEGKEADLTALKSMVSDIDGTVRSFDPASEAGGGAEAPPSGTPASGGAPAPAGEGGTAPGGDGGAPAA